MSHSKKTKHCKKAKCFCLRVPYIGTNPSYSVDILSTNPIAQPKVCHCCCKVKQQPFESTVVVTPIPVAPFY